MNTHGEYLKKSRGGTEKNPYETIANLPELRQACDTFLKETRSEELSNLMDRVELPSLENRVEGIVAIIISEVLTELADEDFNEQQNSWKTNRYKERKGINEHLILCSLKYPSH